MNVTKVHVLLHGFALCEFTLRVPRDWPEGHVWIGKDQREDPKAKEKACKGCYYMAKKLEEEGR